MSPPLCPPPSAPSWTDRARPLPACGAALELATAAKFSAARVWHDAQVSLLITNIGELVTNAPPDAVGSPGHPAPGFVAEHQAALVIDDGRVAWL